MCKTVPYSRRASEDPAGAGYGGGVAEMESLCSLSPHGDRELGTVTPSAGTPAGSPAGSPAGTPSASAFRCPRWLSASSDENPENATGPSVTSIALRFILRFKHFFLTLLKYTCAVNLPLNFQQELTFQYYCHYVFFKNSFSSFFGSFFSFGPISDAKMSPATGANKQGRVQGG